MGRSFLARSFRRSGTNRLLSRGRSKSPKAVKLSFRTTMGPSFPFPEKAVAKLAAGSGVSKEFVTAESTRAVPNCLIAPAFPPRHEHDQNDENEQRPATDGDLHSRVHRCFRRRRRGSCWRCCGHWFRRGQFCLDELDPLGRIEIVWFDLQCLLE